MTTSLEKDTVAQLSSFEQQSLFKTERPLTSPQSSKVHVSEKQLINLCANNYLGLADNPRLIKAAGEAMSQYGLGMASVRFICGTNTLHKQLEKKIAAFLGMEDAILYAACFDANGGLFEPLLSAEDAIISDGLNHASIIDGIRLCKAKRYRFANRDTAELEERLREARKDGARHVMIATDGIFSMDGSAAKLDEINALASKYEATVMIDDCHATGFVGPQGRGTAAAQGVKVDLITGTLGKALGGSIGGFTAGSKPVIEMLRQKSRPYLFSNSLPPAIVAAGIEAIQLAEQADDLRARLSANTEYWREGLSRLGFDLLPGTHPIVPVMVYDAAIAQRFAAQLFDLGVYVTGFFFPVVPENQARIRTQMNATFTKDQLDIALNAFRTVGQNLGVIS